MTQSCGSVPVPACIWSPCLGIESNDDHRLDPIQGVVPEQRKVEARVGWHDLISLGQDVDGACRVGHDLPCQPTLERRDHAHIPIVHHDERVL